MLKAELRRSASVSERSRCSDAKRFEVLASLAEILWAGR
jgi:hypothetical protein